MIDRKEPQYGTLPCTSNHNFFTIYCAMGPKSFRAVMVRKTTAQSKTHQKQCISGASGLFFQVVDWKTHRDASSNQRYFKFVISASHCQQLGLTSVIQFVSLHYITLKSFKVS